MPKRELDHILMGPAGPVADRVVWARTWRERVRGVLGREPLATNEAFVIWPCRQVHTMGVGYPLDVVFCDDRFRVVHVETLEPRSVSKRVGRAAGCVELLGGRAEACGLVRGAQLRFEAPL